MLWELDYLYPAIGVAEKSSHPGGWLHPIDYTGFIALLVGLAVRCIGKSRA